MPTLNLNLTRQLNLLLNECVAKLTIANPLQGSNRSHAARLGITELHNRLHRNTNVNVFSRATIEAVFRLYFNYDMASELGCDVDRETENFLNMFQRNTELRDRLHTNVDDSCYCDPAFGTDNRCPKHGTTKE